LEDDGPSSLAGRLFTELYGRNPPGLRGIQDLSIDFDYPLTAICGRNGCGKTTALALAVLGFHSPEGHFPINAQRRPKRGENTTYYTFRDFFFKGPGDPDITGVEISWQYRGTKDIVIQKRGEKWMHYERRPKRPVDYLGVIRSIPAIEQTTLRARFKADAKSSSTWALNDEYRERLTNIMRRTYDEAGVMATDGYFLRRARAGDTYSSFNMGAGEDVLIDLLLVLQQCEEGSLIVIEEVELGLHPEAQVRFAQHLQEIIRKKKLQVIVSTHSQYFLDSVPREARVLIRRDGSEHSVITKPATKFAVGDMSGTPDPELDVYCEDNLAELLIRESLPGPVRKRIRVLPVGSKANLAEQGAFHLRTRLGDESHMLLVWDGDVRQAEIDNFLRTAGLTEEGAIDTDLDHLNWTTLPGPAAPERWLLEVLDCDDGYDLLGYELGETGSSTCGVIERLKTVRNHHDVAYELGQMYGFSAHQALSCLVRAAARLPSRPLEPVCEVVHAVLDGRRVYGNIETSSTS
jgi:predicted ATPase